MTRRAVTPVLGLVLLVGITAVASVSILLVSATLTDSAQSSIEYEQAERSMSQLAETADSVATAEASRGEFEIRGSSTGQVRASSTAGSINVTVSNRTDDRTLLTLERDLGSYVYTGDDGTEIAYQGGGVWRQDPHGQARMVEPPEFHYRSDPEPTITYPITLVRDDFTRSASLSGDLVAQESERHYPDRPTHYNPLVSGSVLITIQSEYCEAWEQYFRERTDGSAAEACDAGQEGELEIQFSVPFELDGLESGVMLGGEGTFDHTNHGGVDAGDVSDSTQAPSATPLVEAALEDCGEGGEDLAGRTSIDQAGLYCAGDDEMTGPRNYTFDTSDGDIEVAVDGDVFDDTQGSNSGIDVVGDGNLTLYVHGNVLDDGASQSMTIGNQSNPSQTRIFVHSDAERFGSGSNPNIYALIYAPNSNVNLQSASPTFDGAIVADELNVHHNMDISIDSDAASLEFYEEIGDAPFYYLHVSETELQVQD